MTKTEAIAEFGTIRKLADALGITEQAVYLWGDNVPELRAYQIVEILTARPQAVDKPA
jgi:transcriptional repressor of cell division inhibition gene dicB